MRWRPQGIKGTAVLAAGIGVVTLMAAFAVVHSGLLRKEMRTQVGAQQLALVEQIADNIDDRLAAKQGALARAAAGLTSDKVESAEFAAY